MSPEQWERAWFRCYERRVWRAIRIAYEAAGAFARYEYVRGALLIAAHNAALLATVRVAQRWQAAKERAAA